MLRDLRERLASGSAEEYLSRLYERIEKSRLNGFTTLARESALEEAKQFDKNPGRGLLAGLPIAIKECISTKGIETNCSSRILRGYIPPYDAHVIERLKAARTELETAPATVSKSVVERAAAAVRQVRYTPDNLSETVRTITDS